MEEAEENEKKDQLNTDKAMLNHRIKGLIEPWFNNLSVQGTGYKVEWKNNTLILFVGFPNPVVVQLPDKVTVKVLNPTSFTVYSPCKQSLGDFVAYLESIRPVNRYKGFGIRNANKVYILKDIKKK